MPITGVTLPLLLLLLLLLKNHRIESEFLDNFQVCMCVCARAAFAICAAAEQWTHARVFLTNHSVGFLSC